MSIEFYILLLSNALLCAGLFVSSRYDLIQHGMYQSKEVDKDGKMILWRVSYYSEKWFGYFWSKPIINCLPCMASIHSTYFYWYFYEFNQANIIQYLFYIPMLAFMNYLLSKIC